jgi:hypothetical protein
MGWGLKKQPNGLYAIWESAVDNFICVNCTLDEVKERYRKAHGEQFYSSPSFEGLLEEVDRQGFSAGSSSWDECLRLVSSRRQAEQLRIIGSGPVVTPYDWSAERLINRDAFELALEADSPLAKLAKVVMGAGLAKDLASALEMAQALRAAAETEGLALEVSDAPMLYTEALAAREKSDSFGPRR